MVERPAPNERLRNERNRRGWSRAYVAEQVGSDARAVGRWERGTTSPSPYYRQRLCELFEMNAEELGFFRDTVSQGQEGVGQQSEEIRRDGEAGGSPQRNFPPFMIGRGNLVRLLLLLGTVVVTMSLLFWVLLIHFLMTGPTPNVTGTLTVQPSPFLQTPRVKPTILPGGVWVNPADGQIVHGVMHFAAHAYPTNFGDPAIDHVNFTVTWPGGHWQVACIAYPPASGDIFRCDVNLSQIGAPAGQVMVSFDVYDQAGNTHFAPNGEHVIMYTESAPSPFEYLMSQLLNWWETRPPASDQDKW